MNNATFHLPDLTTFCRLNDLGLETTGQFLTRDRAEVACRVAEPDPWGSECGSEGIPRDTVTWQLVHEPFGWRPTTLLISVRACVAAKHVEGCLPKNEILPPRTSLGAGRHRRPTPHRGPGCRGTGRFMEHGEPSSFGRGVACAHR